ncbi:hypothetical protein WS89_04185 [Burkholderia sp. MSMB1072]|uniref:hypothetical protein n=1 Tax=Burkholderia sp. MSMB1072 TaxID=1637871 RepID=UPI00075F17C8|nr:hypothetical protein [Burkholderia sp. MSMB1072]KVH64490.1 hypothetical protein WS89_04185 [Burkholderia sp. MSMB1072]
MKLRRSFSHHERGTKAYQVIEVEIGDQCAVIFQYGKFRAGIDSIEGWSAQVDLSGPYSLARSRELHDRKVKEKTRRDYKRWDTTEMSFRSERELLDALKRLIGPFKSEAVRQLLVGGPPIAASEDEPQGGLENDPKGSSKKAPAPRTEESMPEWATW